MNDRQPPAWLGVLAGIFAAASGIWGLWCVVIGFIGGTLPIIGMELEGGLFTGLLMLFFGEPILLTLAYWVFMLVFTPIGLLVSRRSDA